MDGLQWYLERIGQFPPLPDQELRQLIRQAQRGDEGARDKVISHNLRLVVRAVKPYKSFLSFEDLIQEGNVILMNVLKHYNPRKGKLSTYATKCIQLAILRKLQQEHLIRVPDHIKHLMLKFYKKLHTLSQEYGREMRQEEVMEHLILPDSQKKLLEQALSLQEKSSTSFDAEVGEWVEQDFVDSHAHEAVVTLLNQYFDIQKTQQLLQHLNPREIELLSYRFGIGSYTESHTGEDASKKFHLSRGRIYEMERRGLRKIRYWLIQTRIQEGHYHDHRSSHSQYQTTADRFLSN